MIKILVVDSKGMDGVGWWRNADPLGWMRRQYREHLDIRQVTEDVDFREIKAADIVIMFRPQSAKSLHFIRTCQSAGVKVIADIDDELRHVPVSHPAFGTFREHRHSLEQVFAEVDYVWTSTEPLLITTDCAGRGEVIPNAIMPDQLPDAPAPWCGKGIARWRGYSNQMLDVCSPEARALYAENRDKYDRWQFAGWYPNLDHGTNTELLPAVPPLAFFLELKRKYANVFWKPLVDCIFNDAKSNIAWIEATMAGGVCVTNYAGRPGWECALQDFPTDPAFVAQKWEESKQHILENCNLEKVNARRFSSIVRLMGWQIEQKA